MISDLGKLRLQLTGMVQRWRETDGGSFAEAAEQLHDALDAAAREETVRRITGPAPDPVGVHIHINPPPFGWGEAAGAYQRGYNAGRRDGGHPASGGMLS